MSALFEDPGLFRSLLEDLPIGVYVVDLEHRIRFWNRGAEQITGHLAHDVVGHHDTGHLLKPCDRQGRLLCDENSPVNATLSHGEAQQFSAFYLHKNGSRLAVRVRIKPILEHSDAIVGAINLFEEAFAFREDAGGALMVGCLDGSTGLPSARLSRAVLHECLVTNEESRSGFGLLRIRILGLDDFRARHGAQAVVPFLRTTAHTIRHNLDPEHFVGRWAGDEFVAVLQSASPMAVAQTADFLRRLLNRSEVSWWGDHFQINAHVESTVVRHGEKRSALLGALLREEENGGAGGAIPPPLQG